ncbi:uracil phosphoribosyltransferase [Tistlia consotensis]|uniref:Uracil phosphoribosyltransferase n=1 Tax=Tistlia consotensis USBA 355 TaxID=560819 RepID=A0A1Y6CVX0_9PROT|nr:uracil phosphoribosyltransferase [Tistlia consotensis]SMF82671.1 uracil phosphoribosyltransferase [Tistlia consotensis USBA 355]SNS29776.1 uracil phosphoribosyltransferase [Tistlia consotensis]
MTSRFPTLTLLDHPLIQHKLSLMRDRTTRPVLFRQLLREIGILMGYELTRDLTLKTRPIETPMTTMDAPFLAGPVTLVSILRAGLGMTEGLRELMPDAKEGHIGLFRDPETHQPREYFVKLPADPGRVLLVDPMLATGGSAVHAVEVLLDRGIAARDIRFLCLIAAPEGVERFAAACPDVPILAAALDSHLDENAYIIPGLGDAGDRLYGTEHGKTATA